jgi:hypothetical protein
VWILIVPGVVLTHFSLVKLLPHISDLPQNIVQGFDETFKFAYLEQDSKTVEKTSSDALLKCGVDAATVCPTKAYPTSYIPAGRTSNTTVEKATIVAAFQTSLSIVQKVADDKYLGIDDLKPTADALNTIVSNLTQLEGTMECLKSTPVYCSIYDSAGQIVTGMATVTEALDKFKDSDIVKRWSDHEDQLNALHALPYIMVLALVFLTCFWCRGAVCCCCREGTIAGLALIPFVLLWLTSFVIYLIIFIVGVSIKYFADKIPVPVLRGEPTLAQAIEHLETQYTAFWDLVFADMADGLGLLLNASAFFVAVALIVGLYSTCLCCCCPYRSKAGKNES